MPTEEKFGNDSKVDIGREWNCACIDPQCGFELCAPLAADIEDCPEPVRGNGDLIKKVHSSSGTDTYDTVTRAQGLDFSEEMYQRELEYKSRAIRGRKPSTPNHFEVVDKENAWRMVLCHFKQLMDSRRIFVGSFVD